jgi:MarR family transcriptional regulator, organic hydroperoxide resistance regulator
MSKFGRSPEGRAYDIGLHESALRLHEMFPELEPAIFIAYLTWANMGLTAYQRHSLRFLLIAKNQRLTLGDLASRLETSSANTTKLVNRMQRSGMVRREVDSEDRRVVWIVLTPLGEEKYLAALPISQLDREAFSVLSPEDQENLIDLLTRVQEKAAQLLERASKDDTEDSSDARSSLSLIGS